MSLEDIIKVKTDEASQNNAVLSKILKSLRVIEDKVSQLEKSLKELEEKVEKQKRPTTYPPIPKPAPNKPHDPWKPSPPSSYYIKYGDSTGD